MLLQFSVKNFRSIKEEAVLSLEASSDKEHLNNTVLVNDERVLKVITVFGANAAGKSNLFLALTAAILAIRMSNNRQLGEPIYNIIPFSFDPKTVNEPSEFEFVFVAEGKKYVYGFSATYRKIFTEYLYVYNSSRPTTIFERDEENDEVYRFTIPSIKSELKPLTERNTDNKLFLSTATLWNSEYTRIPMLWFSNMINTYDPRYDNNINLVGDMFEKDEDNSLRHFTNNLLAEADINISDYIFESKDVPTDQLPKIILPNNTGTAQEIRGKAYRIETKHNIHNNKGEVESYPLDMQFESKGTKNIFFMSPIIKHAFETGETVCIDEFDNSLHPMLVSYLVGLFNNPNVNKANAQLIISVHTMSLLTQKELRRDQIYFIEKNQKSGVSELYSLDEYSPRKNENIRKAYLLGRFGAIPEVGEGDGLWQ